MKNIEINKLEIGSILFSSKGTYLVISKANNGKIKCFKETKDPDENNLEITIEGSKRTFKTSSIFSLSCKRIEKLIGMVKEEEDKKLHKVLQDLFIERKKERWRDNIELCVGDLLKFKSQTFVLIDFTATSFVCVPIEEERQLVGYPILLSKATKELKKIGSLSEKEGKNIFGNLKERNTPSDSLPKVGSLIKKENTLYYVYDEKERFFKAVKIDFEEQAIIKIEGVSYFSSLKRIIEIGKKSSSFIKLGEASEEEIAENNQKCSKNKKKKYLEIKKNQSLTHLDTGVLVKLNNTSKEYIFLVNSNQNMVFLNLQKYVEGKFYLETFDSSDCTIIGTISKKAMKEILENLQNKYTSFYTLGEIQRALLLLNREI